LNAANEIAVQAFLERRLPFKAIAATIEETMERCLASAVDDIEGVVAIDRDARRVAAQFVATASA
jgi:1-deoxy-D-xylulose-5-phosphate reductoisomerase